MNTHTNWYVYMCTHICRYTWLYVCINFQIYTSTLLLINQFIYLYIHTYTLTHTHIHKHMHTHTHRYTNLSTHRPRPGENFGTTHTRTHTQTNKLTHTLSLPHTHQSLGENLCNTHAHTHTRTRTKPHTYTLSRRHTHTRAVCENFGTVERQSNVRGVGCEELLACLWCHYCVQQLCCSVLQRVAVCCSALQCVAICEGSRVELLACL